MSPQQYLAKQLLPSDLLTDPHRTMATLTSAAADGLLAAKWAHACATSGIASQGPAPTVVGTTAGIDWQMVAIQLPAVGAAGETLYMAIMSRGSDVRFFYYERGLGPDGWSPSPDVAVLTGLAGGSRIDCGTFRGPGLDGFVAALAQALELPGLRLTAPARPSMPPQSPHTSHTNAGAMPASTSAVALLIAAAAIPAALWGLGWVGVFVPAGGLARPVLSLVAIIVTLVWLHRAFVALRGRTRFSPGMAVGGWFIPVANLVLPAFILRDAWRAARGEGGGVVWLWMVTWLLAVASSILGSMGLTFFGEVGQTGGTAVLIGPQWHIELFTFSAVSLETMGILSGVVEIGLHAVAYGLLALVVHRIGQGSPAR